MKSIKSHILRASTLIELLKETKVAFVDDHHPLKVGQVVDGGGHCLYMTVKTRDVIRTASGEWWWVATGPIMDRDGKEGKSATQWSRKLEKES